MVATKKVFPKRDSTTMPDLTAATKADIETQRAEQRAAMKECIERGRRRKMEEELMMEAEKQERI